MSGPWRRPNPRGFTLLEIMVAVAIMGFVLVSLIGIKNRTMQDVSYARHVTIATMLAKRAMADLVIVKPRATLEEEGQFPEEQFKDFAWKKIVAATPLEQIKEVRVTVQWSEAGRPEQVELVSYE